MKEAATAMWWVPAGHVPDVAEARERLAHLRAHGPTPFAFPFGAPFRRRPMRPTKRSPARRAARGRNRQGLTSGGRRDAEGRVSRGGAGGRRLSIGVSKARPMRLPAGSSSVSSATTL